MVHGTNHLLLVDRPRTLLDVWAQMIIKALATLFATSRRFDTLVEFLGNLRPVRSLVTIFRQEVRKKFIFLIIQRN